MRRTAERPKPPNSPNSTIISRICCFGNVRLDGMEVLYGLHPVEEALRSGSRRFDHLCVARERLQKGESRRLAEMAALARAAGVPVRTEPREALSRLAGTTAHQGVVAVVQERALLDVTDLLEGPEPRLVLALDGVEDPQNLGALLRSAEGAGVDGVVLTERRSAPLSAVAIKASAGAAEHLRLARVVNLVRALETLKERNLWVVGLDERGAMDYDRYDFRSNTVIVLGREGAGLHELVRKTCDHLLRIPMAGQVDSLNVSAAGAVVLFEIARQRRASVVRAQDGATETGPARNRPQKGLGS
jgi:23S rRNA (guanosine2251-2'-O)-methyltransferase